MVVNKSLSESGAVDSHTQIQNRDKYLIMNATQLPVLCSASFHHGTESEMFSTTQTCSGKPNQTQRKTGGIPTM